MPTCANCNSPTDYSNSIDHPDPFKNQWLCATCVKKLTGELQTPLPAPNIQRGQ